MKRTRHHVTDHAIVAYLELVRGVDLEAIRQKIARQTDVAVDHDGCSGVIVDGYRYRIIEDTVVHIELAKKPRVKTGRVRRERVE